MIKIAFLMLCHQDPEQISLLIGKLAGFRDADIYIHADLNHPEIRSAIPEEKGVYLLPEAKSFPIQWGGINMVKATLQLIRTVRETGKAYDYLWLISGQDYPIIPAAEIEQRLAEKDGMNYISMVRPGDDRYGFYRKLYEVAYPPWINKDTIPVKITKRLYKTVTGGKTHTFRRFIRKKPFDFTFFFGSQWWTLTSEAAYRILRFSDDHPEMLKYYEKTLIPDESFFQTVFMMGEFREKQRDGLTFAPMDRSSRHADTLTEQDYEKLMNARGKYCFARKFDSSGRPLIRRIEQGQSVSQTTQENRRKGIPDAVFCSDERI